MRKLVIRIVDCETGGGIESTGPGDATVQSMAVMDKMIMTMGLNILLMVK